MAKILISAGEASGDVHAAAVTAAIKKLDSSAEVFGMAVMHCVQPAAKYFSILKIMV